MSTLSEAPMELDGPQRLTRRSLEGSEDVSPPRRKAGVLTRSDWIPDADFLERMVAEVATVIRGVDPDFEIMGRLKSSESASSKQLRHQNNVRAIHDKVGIRVIVHDLEQCFAAIACLHHEMNYLEQLYDDYITHPKENGYQSLHTTLIAANG